MSISFDLLKFSIYSGFGKVDSASNKQKGQNSLPIIRICNVKKAVRKIGGKSAILNARYKHASGKRIT